MNFRPSAANLSRCGAILEVIALAQHELRQNDIALETRLADQLPFVHADRVQLQQVLLNLIVNAVHAMALVTDRGRMLTIVSNIQDRQLVHVEVRDTGPGVASHLADKLFEPFYTTKPEGLGIGLSICRTIIEAHAGQLSVEPNAPYGTVFRFSLPIQPENG